MRSKQDLVIGNIRKKFGAIHLSYGMMICGPTTHGENYSSDVVVDSQTEPQGVRQKLGLV